MKEKIIKIIKIIAVVFLIFFITVSIFQKLFSSKGGLFGVKFYVIASGSMEPKLHVGDVIMVYDVDKEKIKVGDIVAYMGMEDDLKGKVITHQVEGITTENKEKIFYTKGTANNTMDPAVYEEQIYGKYVCKFYIMSLISKIVRNPIGFVICVITPLGVLMYTEIKDVIKEIKTRKK